MSEIKKALTITIIEEKFKLKHLSILSEAGDDINAVSVHVLIKTLDEIIEEDINEFPVDSIPVIVEQLSDQLAVIAGTDEETEGN